MTDFTSPPASPTEVSRRLASELAFDALAPVIALFLLRLDAHVRYATLMGARVLYVSRAGVRIRTLYRAYLSARRLSLPGTGDILWTSRCMTAKAVWNRYPETALSLIRAQFPSSSLRDVCAALLSPVAGAQEMILSASRELDDAASALDDFLKSNHPVARTLIEHLQIQGKLFEKHLFGVVGTARRVVLVDSGWKGTSQQLLADAFRELDWTGLYFGTMPARMNDRGALERATGLIFESDHFDPDRPSTAITLYRHLIEGLLEPAGHSIEHLEPHPELGAWAPYSLALSQEVPTHESDLIFCSVLAYLRDRLPTQGVSEIEIDGSAAMTRLARVLAYPRAEEALALGGFYSSVDFGRTVRVPVLVQPGDPEQSERRIRESLWPQGQIALEYPSRFAPARQKAELGITRGPDDSFRQRLTFSNPQLPALQGDSAAVAIIVRTVDRPLFLRRALASIGQQTFSDYVCVVICDGGNFALAVDECQHAAIDPRRLIVIENKVSSGIEAASNLAIRQVNSEFVVIHDDDDSWEPGFLQSTVGFLSGTQGTQYGGAVTWVNQVSELSTPAGPVEKSRHLFMTLDAVQFMELACRNLFPPISFLFRRNIYDALGGYDEALPVLGDWDFNLRFLLKADIAVIRERLANYHHRDLEPDRGSGNSVIVNQDRHAAYDVIVRNKILRSAVVGGRPDAMLTVMARMLNEMRAISQRTLTAVESDGEVRAMRDVTGILRVLSDTDSHFMKDSLTGPWYLKRNPDIVAAGVDPVAHWFRIGAVEGRLPTSNPVELARDLLSERVARLRTECEEKERQLLRCQQESMQHEQALQTQMERLGSTKSK